MDPNNVYIDDIYPIVKGKKKTDPKLNILFLQIIACAIVLLAALVIKLVGGDFYNELRVLYIATFEDKTSVSEVLDAAKGFFWSNPDNGGGSREPTSENSSDISQTSTDSVSENTPASEDEVSALQQGEEEDDVTAYIFDFNTVRSVMNMSGGKANSMLMPVYGPITSPFGFRNHPITGVYSMHGGIDIGAPYGTDIRSAAAGKVKEVARSSSYGLYVIIDHQNFETLYAHCSSIKVNEGETVSKGDIIANVGSTGISTGPHLHFEVRVGGCKINPEWVLDKAYFT